MDDQPETLRPVGVVEHYFPRSHVASIRVEHGTIGWGDRIRIRGPGVDLYEPVESMEIEHRHVMEAHDGDRVGIRIHYPVHEGDEVFRQDEPLKLAAGKLRLTTLSLEESVDVRML